MTPGDSLPEDQQLALLVNSAADYAICMLDVDGHVLTWNLGAERLKGYTREAIIGRHFSVFHTEEDRARDHPAEELRVALREGRFEEEGWRVRRDGSRFWANVVITPVHDETGALVGFGKVSRDLTVRRLAEEQSRARTLELEVANKELSEFRRLVSSVRDYAIFMLDPAGYILSWNTGARHLKGYEPDEIVGRHFSVFYSAEDKARNHPANELEVAVREGRYEEEGWRIRKDGSTFWAGVTITAIRDEDGRLTGFAKVTRDLTERKRAEDALHAAVADLRRANEELDRFAAVAAHDMTDPLRTISGFAELISRGERTAEEARAFAGHIFASSVRLSDMLQGLLTYARAGNPVEASQPVAVSAVLEEVLADLGQLIRDADASVIAGGLPDVAVAATPGDLRTVLQNLISNAVKFGARPGPVVRITAEPAGPDAVRVMVTDNGTGVGEADRARIFNAFERAESAGGRAGYGLGLAICQRLVTRHGGRIGIDSSAEGACFWFTLPVMGEPSADHVLQEAGASPSFG